LASVSNLQTYIKKQEKGEQEKGEQEKRTTAGRTTITLVRTPSSRKLDSSQNEFESFFN